MLARGQSVLSSVIIDLLDDRQGVTRYMENGSQAHDGDGWPSAQNPYRDGDVSGPGPYGPGGQSEPREASAGRRDVPFGPDVSWPNGFRRMDPESRRLLQAGFGPGAYDRRDRGYGASGQRPGYAQQAADDYGDPGYSDPSYDGPRGGQSIPARPGDNWAPRTAGGPSVPGTGSYRRLPGHQASPDFGEPARPDFGYQAGWTPDTYPATGAQRAVPGSSTQPGQGSWGRRSPESQTAYPEQWYGHPRLDDA